MNFDELLKTLHQDYLSSLPKKIVTIREQMNAGKTSDLRESFHKLKGTGRTYGMPEVSELGAAVEAICIDHPERAVKAVAQALLLLEEIHRVRSAGRDFTLDTDARYAEIRKLLHT